MDEIKFSCEKAFSEGEGERRGTRDILNLPLLQDSYCPIYLSGAR